MYKPSFLAFSLISALSLNSWAETSCPIIINADAESITEYTTVIGMDGVNISQVKTSVDSNNYADLAVAISDDFIENEILLNYQASCDWTIGQSKFLTIDSTQKTTTSEKAQYSFYREGSKVYVSESSYFTPTELELSSIVQLVDSPEDTVGNGVVTQGNGVRLAGLWIPQLKDSDVATFWYATGVAHNENKWRSLTPTTKADSASAYDAVVSTLTTGTDTVEVQVVKVEYKITTKTVTPVAEQSGSYSQNLWVKQGRLIQFKGLNENKMVLDVFDTKGQLVSSQLIPAKVSTLVNLEKDRFAPGSYHFRLSSERGIKVEHFVLD
ncbi:hypothetical protein OAU52_01065 [bacterium]|nr:hypothetical protein [bacterium]